MITQQEISRMQLPEKLELMEKLWVNISEDVDHVEVPHWHKDMLDERSLQVDEGTAKFLSWAEAKAQLERDCQ